jgi:hypothetical protein
VACQPTPVVPPGFEPLGAPLPAPAVPPRFVHRVASTMPAAPHVAQASPAMPRAATPTPVAPHAAPEFPVAPRAAAAPPATTDSPPPREWSSSLIVYTKRPQQLAPYAPMGPISTTPDRRPPTAVHVTPPVNPHRMVTRAKVSFQLLPDRLVLDASMSPSTPSPIPTSERAALANPNWRAVMEDEYGP